MPETSTPSDLSVGEALAAQARFMESHVASEERRTAAAELQAVALARLANAASVLAGLSALCDLAEGSPEADRVRAMVSRNLGRLS